MKNEFLRSKLAAVLLIASSFVVVGGVSCLAQDSISGKGCTVSETGLGNLVSDAIRRFAGTDIAFVQASLLRESTIAITDLDAPSVRQAVVDPDQAVVVLSLTGKQLREGLERSLSLVPKPNAGFLQVSGINFRYTQSAPPGSRVGDILLGRQAIEPSDSYRVAMPKSLAAGALGYFRVWPDAKPATASPGTVGQAIDRMFDGKVDPARYTPDGRIKRL